MKKISPVVCIIVLAGLLAGCATSYKPIVLESLTYQRYKSDDDFTIEVVDNVLLATNNVRYQKYAQNSSLSIYSVKIANHTNEPITFTYDNFQAYSGTERIRLARLEDSVKPLKQPSAIYLLWGLLWMSFCNGDSCVPIPIGLLIGVINMGTASSANSHVQSELSSRALIGQTVQPGQEVIGVVGLHSSSSLSLDFRIVK